MSIYYSTLFDQIVILSLYHTGRELCNAIYFCRRLFDKFLAMKNLKSKLVLFIILMLFWLLWNNTWDVEIWLYGLVPVLIVIAIFGNTANIFRGVKLTPKGFVYSLYYILYFTWALIKSNIDVMLRVINPKLPIRPGIIKVKTELKSPMARLILANSITLTPGTFIVDIKEEYLYVHWIDVCCEGDPEKPTKLIAEGFENILKNIYE